MPGSYQTRNESNRLLGAREARGAATAAATATTSGKSHASGRKFKNPYFRILRIGFGVFFDADSESPHMT